MSKLLVNNLVRLYARKAALDGNNVLINSVCPGFCDTDMTSGVPCEKVLPLFLRNLSDFSLKLPETEQNQSSLFVSLLLEDLNRTGKCLSMLENI